MNSQLDFPAPPAGVKRPHGVPDSAIRIELPYSEVCMYTRVAGRVMWVEPLERHMAQLWTDDAKRFSVPITAAKPDCTFRPRGGPMRADLARAGARDDLPLNVVYGARLTVPRPPRPDLTLPEILVALPNGEQGTLPGLTWPQMGVRQPRRGIGGRGKPKPVVSLYETDIDEADRLIQLWGHPLKKPAAKRPFGKMSYLLAAFNEPVAVTVSASSPNRSVHQDHLLHRYNTVDLARIARRDPPATLAALRLWREYLAPLYSERYAESGWGREPLHAAITYSLPGTPSSAPDGGGICRRDGWRCLRRRKVTQPGRGSRQGASETAAIADGVTGLWAWIYDPAAT